METKPSKIYMITGASRGIGLEIVRHLLTRSDKSTSLIGIARSWQVEDLEGLHLAQVDVVDGGRITLWRDIKSGARFVQLTADICDVATSDLVHKIVKEIAKVEYIDCLIHNAA